MNGKKIQKLLFLALQKNDGGDKIWVSHDGYECYSILFSDQDGSRTYNRRYYKGFSKRLRKTEIVLLNSAMEAYAIHEKFNGYGIDLFSLVGSIRSLEKWAEEKKENNSLAELLKSNKDNPINTEQDAKDRLSFMFNLYSILNHGDSGLDAG